MRIKRFIQYNLITEGLTKSTVGDLSQELFGNDSLTKTKYKELEDKPIDVKTNEVKDGVEVLDIQISEPPRQLSKRIGGWSSDIPTESIVETAVYKLIFETKVDDKIFYYHFSKIIYYRGLKKIDVESGFVKGYKTTDGKDTLEDSESFSDVSKESYLDPKIIKMVQEKYPDPEITNVLKRFK
jgi:hypothetical protein